jgi:hypothetical protein
VRYVLAATLVLILGMPPAPALPTGDRAFQEVRRIRSDRARQAPAADTAHVYAIDNRAIAKHDKRTGELVDSWEGDDDGPIIHLNSGIVLDGRLYAAHSNYPGLPMVSSIEVFDVETMEHVDTHSFGIHQGSATWVDRHDGSWWVAFANYGGRGGQPGRDPSWTTVERFDDEWRVTGGWIFPDEVVGTFENMSNSGGAWGPDGHLYVTGHDAPMLFEMRLPLAGSVLELVQAIPATAEGQGIAWDPVEAGTLYTILRSRREIVVSRMVQR